MTQPRPAPKRPIFWVMALLALAVLGTLSVVLARPAAPDRVLILASALDSQGKDLGAGMGLLLADCMEVLSGATVTHAQQLPSRTELEHMPPLTRLLRFQGKREGNLLSLSLEWNSAARLLEGKPWRLDAVGFQDPGRTMSQVVQRWPLAIRRRQLDALIPKSAAHFWELLEGLSIHDDQLAADHLTASALLTQEEPRCATAWVALGDHLYRSLWVNPGQAGIGLNSRTHRTFQQAVDLVPGYPRASFLWSLMLTDTGNQNLALQVLKRAIHLRPGVPDLYLGVAYAGRTSGLLEVARRALTQRGKLLGPLTTPSAWFAETTYLYLGDLEAFVRDLARTEAFRQNADLLFYRGYFSLLQGQPKQALAFMRSGADPGMEPVPFRDLCRVYQAYLEGRPKDGLADLRTIDEVRGKLRIPDGEWTFKEAEAYSLLGDADRGVDCATRAFVQGFSCATWYETSPFLDRVRQHPRWLMLRRNIRERQAVMEGSFPPSSFDP